MVEAQAPLIVIIALFLGAIGFVVALAWNDFIQALVKQYTPVDSSGIRGQFYYVVIVTVLLIIIGYTVARYYPSALPYVKK